MTISRVFQLVGAAALVLLVGCVPTGGGGGGNNDGGVLPIGGQGGGGGGAGGQGGGGGGQCTPNCVDKTCGPDGCGGVCGTCEDGLRCIGGSCSDEACPGGTIDCSGVCTEALSDPQNCGNCGNACPTAAGLIAECIQAECFLTCPSERGNGVNVDLMSDVNHCGECGNRCPSIGGQPAVCENGVCADPCQAEGLTGCGDSCVDTQFDPLNCGGCGTVCPNAENGQPSCEGGLCQDPCSGLTNCNDVCVDTFDDDNNCGGCGVRCTDGTTCDGGACTCPDGAGLADLATDTENCGFCGNACPEVAGGERACEAGLCADACGGGQNECNGACVSLRTDADNCGMCGNDCGRFQPRALANRSPLEETDSSVERLNCVGGRCLFAVTREYRFPNSGGAITACDFQCAEAGLNPVAAAVPFQSCADVPFAEAAFGCAVYSGVNSDDAVAVNADTPIPPRAGLGGSNRRAVVCACEGTDPLLAAPLPGGNIPAPGNYMYEMADREYLVAHFVATANEFYFEPNEGGTVELYDANWNEIGRRSDLNFSPVLVAPISAGRQYFVLYAKFPEFGDLVQFAIDF